MVGSEHFVPKWLLSRELGLMRLRVSGKQVFLLNFCYFLHPFSFLFPASSHSWLFVFNHYSIKFSWLSSLFFFLINENSLQSNTFFYKFIDKQFNFNINKMSLKLYWLSRYEFIIEYNCFRITNIILFNFDYQSVQL